MYVRPKYKIGDVVDYLDYNRDIIVCIIKYVDSDADDEDNFEPSYGLVTKDSDDIILGGSYESRLSLNKKYLREKKIDNLLDT